MTAEGDQHRVIGDRDECPYAEERLPGKWIIRDKEDGVPTVRSTTLMEEILIEACVEAMRPLSKTQMRDFCATCGDTKQQKIDKLTRDLSLAEEKCSKLEISLESLTQQFGLEPEEGKEDEED